MLNPKRNLGKAVETGLMTVVEVMAVGTTLMETGTVARGMTGKDIDESELGVLRTVVR